MPPGPSEEEEVEEEVKLKAAGEGAEAEGGTERRESPRRYSRDTTRSAFVREGRGGEEGEEIKYTAIRERRLGKKIK